MANRKISDLTALTATATGDLLPIVDISEAAAADKNKKITIEKLFQGIPGNVGIGTSSPALKLSVDGDVWLGNGGGVEIGRLFNDSGVLHLRGSANVTGLALGTNNTRAVTIDSSQRVGIGTTSPGYSLHIFGSTANLAIHDSGANGTRALIEATNSAVYYGSTYGSSNIPTIFSQAGASGGIERMRIDSSGRLLVGTSTARANLYNSTFTTAVQVEGTSYNTTGMLLTCNVNDDTTCSVLNLVKSRGTTVGSNTLVSSGDTVGAVSFAGNDGTEFVQTASIKAEVDGTPGANDMPGRLVFSTTADGAATPTERMRIESTGRTGTYVSAADGFQVSSNALAGTTYANFVGRFNGGAPFGGTISLQIWNNGNIQNTNNSYGAISDIKLKENIVDANSQWGDLKALQVRNYNFKEGQTHAQIGLVAQEAELVSPGLVYESPDRDTDGNDLGTVTKSVNYSVLYMKAVKALQEAMERIETLEARLTAAGIE
jgi:hypothetical protein